MPNMLTNITDIAKKLKFPAIALTVILLGSGVSPRAAIFAQATDLARQKAYADSLFETGDFYKAITEYKRLAFFDAENNFEFYANFKIALAYKNGGFFDNALEYFDKAQRLAKTEKELSSANFETVKTLILAKRTNKALNLLDKLERENYEKSQVEYWRGWAYLFARRLNLSSYHFANSGKADELAVKIKSLSDSVYSVSTAKLLSYIIPGAGQFYAGEYFSGAMSFAWNALWIYVTANAFIDGRIIEGFLVADLLWLRFYRGNIQNAERFAIEKNVKLVNKLLINLQKNYKGEKP